MGFVDQAVKDGMRIGFENAAFARCDGSDDGERCPQTSKQPCICTYVHWRRLPWWRRMWRREPPRPSQDDCFSLIIRQAVDDALWQQAAELRRTAERKRKAAARRRATKDGEGEG